MTSCPGMFEETVTTHDYRQCMTTIQCKELQRLRVGDTNLFVLEAFEILYSATGRV